MISTAIKTMTSSKSKENIEPNKITKKPNNLKGLWINLLSLDQKNIEDTQFVSVYAKQIFEFQKDSEVN